MSFQLSPNAEKLLGFLLTNSSKLNRVIKHIERVTKLWGIKTDIREVLIQILKSLNILLLIENQLVCNKFVILTDVRSSIWRRYNNYDIVHYDSDDDDGEYIESQEADHEAQEIEVLNMVEKFYQQKFHKTRINDTSKAQVPKVSSPKESVDSVYVHTSVLELENETDYPPLRRMK